MTKIYKKKREHLLSAVSKHFGEGVKIMGSDAGLHIALQFLDKQFTSKDQETLKTLGIEIDLMTDYLLSSQETTSTDTLIMGFGHLSIEAIEEGIIKLNAYIGKEVF